MGDRLFGCASGLLATTMHSEPLAWTLLPASACSWSCLAPFGHYQLCTLTVTSSQSLAWCPGLGLISSLTSASTQASPWPQYNPLRWVVLSVLAPWAKWVMQHLPAGQIRPACLDWVYATPTWPLCCHYLATMHQDQAPHAQSSAQDHGLWGSHGPTGGSTGQMIQHWGPELAWKLGVEHHWLWLASYILVTLALMDLII